MTHFWYKNWNRFQRYISMYIGYTMTANRRWSLKLINDRSPISLHLSSIWCPCTFIGFAAAYMWQTWVAHADTYSLCGRLGWPMQITTAYVADLGGPCRYLQLMWQTWVVHADNYSLCGRLGWSMQIPTAYVADLGGPCR